MMTETETDQQNQSSGMEVDGWPKGVTRISVGELDNLGVNTKTGRLYWDGVELMTANVFTLGTFERWLAGAAAAGTFGVFVIELGRSVSLWH